MMLPLHLTQHAIHLQQLLPFLVGGWQIGPRIRIGGTVGKIGQELKIGTGKVLSNPLVDTGLSLIPGVGPGIAAAANASGHILDTSNGGIHTAGDVLKLGAGAASTYGVGKLANGALGKVLAAGRAVYGGGGSTGSAGGSTPSTNGSPGGSGGSSGGDTSGGDTVGANDVGNGGDIAGTNAGDGSGSGTNWLDVLKGLGGDVAGGVAGAAKKLAGGVGGLTAADLAKLGLLGGTVAETAADRQRQQSLQDKAIGYATGSYDQNAGARQQARNMLANNGAPDLSSIFADPGNPYARGRTVPVTAATSSADGGAGGGTGGTGGTGTPIPAVVPGQGRSVYGGPGKPIPAVIPGQGRSVYSGPHNGAPPAPAAPVAPSGAAATALLGRSVYGGPSASGAAL